MLWRSGPVSPHVKEGDRIGVPWLYSACGFCEHCLGGWETLCESQQNTGYSVNGGFADYTLADAGYVGRLPDNVGFVELAPVLCAGVTVYKGLKMTDTRPGQWVVISGIGGLGHMAVQYAKAMGLNVAAVDIDDGKLALAERLGATVTVNAMKTDPAAYLKRPLAVPMVRWSPQCRRRPSIRRKICCAVAVRWYLMAYRQGDFPLPIFSTVLNGITIRGSIVGTRSDLQEALDFAAEGKVEATVATDTLDNINDVFSA
ncbi:hypothetical protein HAALTHF_21050n [Vreelandella aquamarina]|nr:hypothetical protein HAALTHF_21050n [Halomonas axialensis]